MRLLMVGPPGSGKGTHGVRLAEEFGIAHVSSGDALRAAIAGGGPLGRAVGDHVARGDLVPDDMLFELMVPITVHAAHETGGFIADGFPRTPAQARRACREIGVDRDLKFHAVVSLDVPEDVLVRRLTDRAREQGRADDTPEVIQHRLAVYRDETRPLVDFYRDRGLLVPIDGDRPPDDVYAEIRRALRGRLPAATPER